MGDKLTDEDLEHDWLLHIDWGTLPIRVTLGDNTHIHVDGDTYYAWRDNVRVSGGMISGTTHDGQQFREHIADILRATFPADSPVWAQPPHPFWPAEPDVQSANTPNG